MMAGVVQDVGDGVAGFARGGQDAGVIAVCEDAPLASDSAIDRPGDADAEALHSTGEGAAVVRFHDEVDVAVLDRMVDEAKAEAFLSLRECALDRAIALLGAEFFHRGHGAQRDVERLAPREARPGEVRHHRLVALWLSSRPRSAAAPPPEW